MKRYTTACPRNCYSTCSLHVYMDEERNRIARIEAHPANKATPKGACLKGLSYVERVVSKDRILTPLRRKSGGLGFKPISWDEALDTIANKLRHIKETYGPQSLFYYSSSGTKGLMNGIGSQFWRMFGGYTTTYGDLCWPAGLEATRLTFGTIKHNVPWDIENARLIVLWGKNVAETNVQQMRSIDIAIQKGAKLIVIDPRRTLTADRAELLVQPRPGTDGALALGIAHMLIKTGAIDHEFIRNFVLGFPEFKEMVMKFTPEQAARISDVPINTIYRLAREFSQGKPITLSAGFGMQRYTNSGQAMRAMIALMVITGNIGAPGASWQFADLQSSVFDSIKDPFSYYPPDQPDGVARISISTARLGRDMLAQKDPPLKMSWVERGNPITQNPETNTVLKAFRSLDFRVVVEQFFTDTANEADIILPAKTLFEQSDVIGAYWHPYIQLKQKIMEPPGQVKPESEIYRLLAEGLGMSNEIINKHLPGTSNDDIDAFLEEKMAPFPELSLEKLKSGPILAPGVQEVAFEDFVFTTRSGKIELLSQEAHLRWGADLLPVYIEPKESIRGEGSENIPYPLYMMTPNTKNRIHSQFNNLKMIRQFSPKPVLTINPEDAEKRQINHKDIVKVYNDRGNLELEAHIDFSMKTGCVCITNGWWISEGGTVNFLSLGRETDMGHGAAFHDNLVEVTRL
jgi:anaerobic selenocysteine-containing dehydrogenase